VALGSSPVWITAQAPTHVNRMPGQRLRLNCVVKAAPVP